jgi:hypothetical protein
MHNYSVLEIKELVIQKWSLEMIQKWKLQRKNLKR